MEFKGQQIIKAPRAVVWAGLNEPQVLQQCIDGCESFIALSEDQWQAVVRASVGPVKARFKGLLTVSEREHLTGYKLVGEGEGGIAGFGKMIASVKLEDAGSDTLLTYVAEAEVGGKLAQIGSRLISSVAIKMADAFFTKFNEVVTSIDPSGTTSKVAPAFAKASPVTSNLAVDDTANVELTVNKKPVRMKVDDRTLLVELLRRELHLTGTHVGCDTTQCGACTVNLDGVAVKSCTVLAVQASGGEVTTIEGIAPEGKLHPLQQGFIECHGLQCGFCTPGMIMASDGLLRSGKAVNDESICEAIEGNICRCTGYVNIIEAVKFAARETKSGGGHR